MGDDEQPIPPVDELTPVQLNVGSPDDVDEPPTHWDINAHADDLEDENL